MDIEQWDDEKARMLVEQYGVFDPKLDLAKYKYPTLALLNNSTWFSPVSAEELDKNKNIIVQTLEYQGVRVSQIKATVGPRVTLYEIVPSLGTRITQVVKMEDDLALRLGIDHVKVLGAMRGKGTIGIEVLHPHQIPVPLRSLLSTDKFQSTKMDLPIALGLTLDNEVFMTDLAVLPHLLLAGTTGQGKSVMINAILSALLFKKHPAEMKLVLIDFNSLELSPYQKIERHFLAKLPDAANAISTDIHSATETLKAVNLELDQRIQLFSAINARSIKEYNQKYISRQISDPELHRYLPHIVVVIDEFADLVAPVPFARDLITRLAQMGRPVGIHFIIATQRPTIGVITGDLKANFMTRLAFRVATSIDSRTIIDEGGAEKLQGNGDFLYYQGKEPLRLQSAMVTTKETQNIVEFIGAQQGYPTAMYLPVLVDEIPEILEFDPDNLDPLFVECAMLIVMHQQASTSLIQRKLKLGYNRAGRIVEQLEAAKIIGPFEGSKAREVNFADEYTLNVYLEELFPKQQEETVVLPPIIEAPVPNTQTASADSAEPVKKKSLLRRLFRF